MNQMTLRQIPDKTYKQLKNIAKKNHTSINKTAIALINKSLGIETGSAKKRDLSSLAGTWSAEEFDEFNKNTAAFNKIDKELWRS